jgi:ElaB/YqjD/DUF883 family membrane-anchored ribosome-binding protein
MTQKKTAEGEMGSFVENMRGLASEAARETMAQVRAKTEDAYDYGRKKVERGMDDVQSYVQEKPLQALCMALGAGFVIGFLLRGRRS